MRILVISHNVFSHTTAMGKTLASYFSGLDTEDIAQFYIHSEVPVDADVCADYFRFTDIDAVKARLPFRERGTVYRRQDVRTDREFTRTDEGVTARIYQKGRRRTAQILFLRNAVWKTAAWKTKKLRNWILDFHPDLVFFASGDYAFMYDIARYAANLADCPLVVSCMDDFYLKKPADGWFAGRVHASYMRDVRRTMRRADLLVCMCDEMSRAYQKMFHVKARTLYTGVPDGSAADGCGSRISYIGNVGAYRKQALLELGSALCRIHEEGMPDCIDVYSQEKDPAIADALKRAPGICFRGPVPAEQVFRIMQESMLVVHAESMAEPAVNPARFSISTKIPESLMRGPCLLAYGPEGLASIDYLKRNNAAYVITSQTQLEDGLREIITDAALRRDILANARKLAYRNHTAEQVQASLVRYCTEASVHYKNKKGTAVR